jgi:PII-like signaling protein
VRAERLHPFSNFKVIYQELENFKRMKENTCLLKIYISASDMVGKKLLYEEIVREARDFGLGGSTVFQGIISFGASHSIHGTNVIFPTHQSPVAIEIVDEREKIDLFYSKVEELIDQSGKGALVTLREVDVLLYKRGAKYNQFGNF